MKRVMLLVGARPNMMKAAAILDAMSGDSRFQVRLVHTGQHYDDDMSEVFIKELGLPQPDVYLGVGEYTPLQQMGRILLALESELLNWKPDLFVVVGDVNSTVVGAQAANKLSIPVAHVEAGLRSFDRSMPEEFNRILTDHISDYLFTTSREANENLEHEGIPAQRIYFVGNVMVDTLLRFRRSAQMNAAWQDYDLRPRSYALLTLHRPSNVDDVVALRRMVDLLVEIAARLPVIFPVHPRTKVRLLDSGLLSRLDGCAGLTLTPPLGYLSFVSLMAEARVVLTDSGGIQEETTVLGIPCLTLRENTERPITIIEGTNHLVGTNPIKVLEALDEVMKFPYTRNGMPELWDGQAAHRIVEILAD